MVFEDFIHLVSVSPTRCAGIASTGVTILLFVITPFDTEVVENVLAPCGFVFSRNNLIQLRYEITSLDGLFGSYLYRLMLAVEIER